MKNFIRLLALGVGAVALTDGFNKELEVTHYEASSPKIPASFDGFKIAQISDYHCDTVPGVSYAVLREKPDIIVSTGDLADDEGSFKNALRLCERLVAIAPLYAVTGNHDLWRKDYSLFDRAIKSIGVTSLHNSRITIDKKGDAISLCGIDDPFTLNRQKALAYLDKSLSALGTQAGYNILLFHRANLFDALRDKGFDLILAGHMHGGHVRLPALLTNNKLGVGVAAPSSGWASGKILFPKYTAGRYGDSSCQMIVSRGIGNPMIIPRIYNRPEITVITLRHI